MRPARPARPARPRLRRTDPFPHVPTRTATRFPPHRSRRLRDKNRRGVDATRNGDINGRGLIYADYDFDPSTQSQVCCFCHCACVRPRSAPRAPPRVHTLSMRKPADLCQESTPHKNSADGSSLFVTAMFPFEVSSDGAPARLGLLGLDHNACRCCRLRLFGAFPPLPPARPRRMTSAQT